MSNTHRQRAAYRPCWLSVAFGTSNDISLSFLSGCQQMRRIVRESARPAVLVLLLAAVFSARLSEGIPTSTFGRSVSFLVPARGRIAYWLSEPAVKGFFWAMKRRALNFNLEPQCLSMHQRTSFLSSAACKAVNSVVIKPDLSGLYFLTTQSSMSIFSSHFLPKSGPVKQNERANGKKICFH